MFWVGALATIAGVVVLFTTIGGAMMDAQAAAETAPSGEMSVPAQDQQQQPI
jgi:hypothetical protein